MALDRPESAFLPELAVQLLSLGGQQYAPDVLPLVLSSLEFRGMQADPEYERLAAMSFVTRQCASLVVWGEQQLTERTSAIPGV